MNIQDIRSKQIADQLLAIKSRQESGGITRIGHRDPVTGTYQVLDSDGGVSGGGIKIYTAQEQWGDRVLAFPRNDGTIALDSEKGSKIKPPIAFHKCPGYLNRQIFNCDEKPSKKEGTIWVFFEHQGRFFVGGHKQEPELVYDAFPPETPLSDSKVRQNAMTIVEYGRIWGDSDGWEASFPIKYPSDQQYVEAGAAQGRRFALICSAISGAARLRDFDGSLGNRQISVGKGVYANKFNFRQTSTSGFTNTQSWNNAIADFESRTESSGTLVSRQSVIAEGISARRTSSLIDQHPAPFDSKILNESYEETFGIIPKTRTISKKDSYTLFFRDREGCMFMKLDSSLISGMYEPLNDVSFVFSTGNRDTALFSAGHIPDAEGGFPFFGDPDFGFHMKKNRYKLNNPSVTLYDRNNNNNFEHLNAEKEYKIRVFNIFERSSVIDGEYELAELTAWGIPDGAIIVDVAAWVP